VISPAGAPVSFGVDFADAPGNPPWADVLDGIAAAGLDALELGPAGYLPEDPERLRAALGERGLHAVGSFVFEPLHDPACRGSVLTAARRACAQISAAGGSLLVIVDRPSPERAATAGRRAAGAPSARFAPFRDTLLAVAEIAGTAGLTPVLHPHAGTYLEREDEIERMLDATGLDVCADSGHLAYAGLDPVEWVRAHADRIRHVHLKDLRLDVARSGLGFWEAVAAGVFVPLGAGDVDLGGVLGVLRDIGYRGHAVLEQDRSGGAGGDPVSDLRHSLAHLRSLAGP
jgi:inosose dehydratase